MKAEFLSVSLQPCLCMVSVCINVFALDVVFGLMIFFKPKYVNDIAT